MRIRDVSYSTSSVQLGTAAIVPTCAVTPLPLAVIIVCLSALPGAVPSMTGRCVLLASVAAHFSIVEQVSTGAVKDIVCLSALTIVDPIIVINQVERSWAWAVS